MTRPLIATLGLLLVPASAFGQAAKTDPTQPATTSEAAQSPPFVASLLFIKADWSQPPAAKEIDADLRAAWGKDHPSLKLLDENSKAKPGPGLLFSTGSASIYTEEHYAQLLAWLKARQLFQQIEPFKQIPSSPSGESFTAWLQKDAAFFGVPASGNQDDPFFTRGRMFTWTISAWTTQWDVQRLLLHYEKGRGQDKPKVINTNELERCHISVDPLPAGHVLIVHAFPGTEDIEHFQAAHRQGFHALIVIEKRQSPPPESAEPRLLLPDKVERIQAKESRGALPYKPEIPWSPLVNQPAPAASPSRNIISKDVMISWSEGKDVARGFSKSLGKWAEQKMDPPATDTAPAVSQDLAVWRVGNAYYAFSSQTGRWDVLRLPEGHTPVPQLQDDFALVHDGDTDYTFANSTGRWSSPKDSEASAHSRTDENEIKVFTLRHAKAIDAQVLINQLFARDIHSAAADERSNSLIVRGPEAQLNIIFAILTRLDALEPPGPAQSSNVAAWPKPVTTATVAERAKQFDTKEAQAAALARQIRELQSGSKGDKVTIDRAKIDKLTADLRKVVGEALSARQELHRAEAAQLQQRTEGIQQSLRARASLSDQIVDRRVKDLLNPDLQWEAARGNTQASLEPALGGSRASETAVSPAQPLIDLSAATAYRNKLQQRWEQVEMLYQRGRFQLNELLQAAKDLGEAELAAAAISDERLAARQAIVERLRGVKSIVDAKFQAQVEPENSKLAVDAEVLKAEAALAAVGAGSRDKPPLDVPPARASSEQPSTGEERRVLRSPSDFHNRLSDQEALLAQYKALPPSQFQSDDRAENAKSKQQAVDRAQRDLNFLREEYAAQLRLLSLEVQDAEAEAFAANNRRNLLRENVKAGRLPKSKAIEAEQAADAAKRRLERAKTLYELYLKADPQNSSAPPAAGASANPT